MYYIIYYLPKKRSNIQDLKFCTSYLQWDIFEAFVMSAFGIYAITDKWLQCSLLIYLFFFNKYLFVSPIIYYSPCVNIAFNNKVCNITSKSESLLRYIMCIIIIISVLLQRSFLV